MSSNAYKKMKVTRIVYAFTEASDVDTKLAFQHMETNHLTSILQILAKELKQRLANKDFRVRKLSDWKDD